MSYPLLPLPGSIVFDVIEDGLQTVVRCLRQGVEGVLDVLHRDKRQRDEGVEVAAHTDVGLKLVRLAQSLALQLPPLDLPKMEQAARNRAP